LKWECDLAEDEKSFVGGEGDLVVAVEASAVVDPAVGAFDHRTFWLGNESTSGFRLGHDVDLTPALVAASVTVVPLYRCRARRG
jgi:hypothetical protein